MPGDDMKYPQHVLVTAIIDSIKNQTADLKATRIE
jgi:hypothetical protein